MSQDRARRARPTGSGATLSRLVALISASVIVLGLSLVGVAQADDPRDGDGGHRGLLAGEPERQNVRPGRAALDERRQARDRDADAGSDELDRLEPAAPAGGLVAGTPCSRKAVACVSLTQKKSWLFTEDEDGDIVVNHGPVPVSTGGPGKETPLGDYVVEWKDKNHRSGEYFVPRGCKPPTTGCVGAPMNWAVFFAEGGIAFHEGTLAIRSSGCVRMSGSEAEFYYNTLSLGDKVEVRA